MENLHEPAIKELEAKLAEIESQAEGFRASIKALRNLSSHSPEVATDTKKQISFGFSIVDKVGKVSAVLNAIQRLNRFVKIQEIADNTSFEASKVRSAVSALLADNQITKIQVTTSNNDTFWGLHNWKEGNKVKSEYMYDKSQLQGHKLLIE
jgi:hypothetical protein